ncbi:hypothetical protein J4710_01880 [Staphylococcus xylosus]|uniref:Uncharacterized protein n=1 Tax=Staphylococcus xylosus TaxID=1288 RepID=A0A939NGN6_STAXY|nr:hypothetical protein [Staphylococcus xylosus]
MQRILGQQSNRAIYQFIIKTDKSAPFELTLFKIIHTDDDDILKFIEEGQIIGSSINLA